MTKESLLKELDKYSHYHSKKNKKLDYFILGITKDEQKICLKIHNCKMQQWFKERRTLLNNIYGIKRMKKLDAYLEEWQEETQKICKIFVLQEERKKTFTQKIFSIKKTKKNDEKYLKEADKISIWKSNILEVTMKIESKFKMMQNRLDAMPQKQIEIEIFKAYPQGLSKEKEIIL